MSHSAGFSRLTVRTHQGADCDDSNRTARWTARRGSRGWNRANGRKPWTVQAPCCRRWLSKSSAWLRTPDVAPSKITQVVRQDPVLAAHVVRLANSAPADRPPPSRHSVKRSFGVGTTAVRQMVTATCVTSKLKNRRPTAQGPRPRRPLHRHGVSRLAGRGPRRRRLGRSVPHRSAA